MLLQTGTYIPARTARKTAEDIAKSKRTIKGNLENLERRGEILTEVITGMNPEDTEKKDLDAMAQMVSDDIDGYVWISIII